MTLLLVLAMFTHADVAAGADLGKPPYPPSPVIQSITWHWDSYRTAAPGSDLWPVTWGPDDHLYTAWGDGGGFGGTDSDGRVSMGFARIEGRPENYHAANVNGGKDPEHPASFPSKGKTGGTAFVGGTLYASINLQDGPWPNVNHALAWSTDRGATWTKADWLFTKGPSNFQPARFLQFGKDYSGVPARLAGYVYLYGPKQKAGQGDRIRLYLARVPKDKIRERAAYEFFHGLDAQGKPVWTARWIAAQPVFTDANGITASGAVYNPAMKRFLLTSFHTGPGQLGVFDAPDPWGPWTTVAYYDRWGKMGATGEGLTCEFPQKWISADGLTLWSVFSVYGAGGKQGIHAHDKFNLVKVTILPSPQPPKPGDEPRQFPQRMEVPARHFVPVNGHFYHAQAKPLGQYQKFQVEQVAGFHEGLEETTAGRGAEHLESALRVQHRNPQQSAGHRGEGLAGQPPVPITRAADGRVRRQPRADGHIGTLGDRSRQTGMLLDRRGAVRIGKQQQLSPCRQYPRPYGRSLTLVLSMPQQAKLRPLTGQTLDDRRRFVAAAVVNHDHLVGLPETLIQIRADALQVRRQPPGLVQRRKDHGKSSFGHKKLDNTLHRKSAAFIVNETSGHRKPGIHQPQS
jgi:hypothetical protein